MITTTKQTSPELLRNSVDQRIVRIRPTSTPIDQLSRCAGSRSCGSMTVEYYSVDTKQTETTNTASVDLSSATDRGMGTYTYKLPVKDVKIFEPSETILFPSVKVQNTDSCLVAYVYGIDESNNTLEIVSINGPIDSSKGENVHGFPIIPSGNRVVRMGRAATELDVMTPQFQALPKKASNNCQIFKMQIEESTLHKIAEKEVGWTFSDQEEAAVIDMRLGMEKNFLFGSAAVIFDAKKNESVYLTGGIWNQTSKTFNYQLADFDETTLIEMCSKAFTGNNGSKRKILLAGTKMIEAISKLPVYRTTNGGKAFVKWGIEFREIQSNFGSLYVLHSEIFDQCGHAADGFVIDPDYITKYTHIPFSVEKLDLRSSGVRNTSAVVLTEASCLVLRYPEAHMRIIGA